MAHRPYPNPDRALRHLARRTPAPEPTEFQQHPAQQASRALAAASAAMRPLVEGLRRTSGGTTPPYRPHDDERLVQLSPGWVSPNIRRCLPDEMIERINTPRRPRP
ncbi:hypothetical protein [Streptomyces lavendofoliae]|uniref:Uncharacterized protein n=1 Tax=Streptomyces lavendofoliae TaxID=67314 RepID=A0A918M736_9ACTN|nr:hypothetical protein [Streptomyces lavendofoliae]GGU62650.1 hypothetical protein GCM10010274_59320 [Streptomyces lavendofoliae]